MKGVISLNFGRDIIYTDEKYINRENVVSVLNESMTTHLVNSQSIDTLYNYYKGKTDVLNKSKEFREKINNKINESRAFQIVSFHKGYTFGEPIQYVRRENSKENKVDDVTAENVNLLNTIMAVADKSACDNDIAEWLYIGGAGYRLVLPAQDNAVELFSLDPRNTFVVYENSVRKKPVMAVTYITRKRDSEKYYSVYTDREYFEICAGKIVKQENHYLGSVPIIEYPANNSRLGVFEIVKALLDAIDALDSNRMDDVVQFVNSFLAIMGGEISEETYNSLEEYKMLSLPEGTDAKYLSVPMNQASVQTLKDDLYKAFIEICGLPNRNGGSSTSDTGAAVIMRDGWQDAERRAKATELMFKRSEKQFLKIAIRILENTTGMKLSLFDIDIHFTRRNYENIASKSQVLIAMLNCDKIADELAFSACGMFADPESAYLQSKAEYETNLKRNSLSDMQKETNEPVRNSGSEVSEM